METVTLVLLPGLDGTDVFFRPLVAALPPHVQPLIVGFPKRGASSYSNLLEIIRAATAGIEKFHVLGLSFSGPLAVMLAAEDASRVEGIILAGTFVRLPRRILKVLRFACVGPVLSPLRALRMLALRVSRNRNDALRQAEFETWTNVSSRDLAARAREIVDVDVRSTLGQCSQPVLYIAFEGDRLVPRRNANDVLRASPTAHVQMLPGGHFSGVLNGDTLSKVIVRFLSDSKSV